MIRKMQFYGISESKVKNIINRPTRVEEGIAPNTAAVMQPAPSETPQEIWVMYQTAAQKTKNPTPQTGGVVSRGKPSLITIISAWRYPGISPEHGRIPIPPDIAEELGIIV